MARVEGPAAGLGLAIGLLASAAHAGPLVGPRTVLDTNAATDAADDMRPGIANDGKGQWVAIWGAREQAALFESFIRTASSGDDGATWSTPYDGAWIATWWSVPVVPTGDSDILVSRSTDGGLTWSPVALVEDDVADTGFDFEPSIATDGRGTWLVAWNGRVGASVVTDTLVARSTDDGSTFGPPTEVRPGPSTYDEWSTSLATDGSGQWVLVWQFDHYIDFNEHFDGEVLMSRSIDAGASWTPVVALNEDPWGDDAWDRTPRIVTGRRGTWRAVWTTDGEIEPGIGTDTDIAIVQLDTRELPSLSPVGLAGLGALLLASALLSRRTRDGVVEERSPR